MKDRVVAANSRRYELVPSAGTGPNGGAYYDVYVGYTANPVGTPLKSSVLFDDALAPKYGLDNSVTDYTATNFPSPSNALRDVWKFIYPVGTIFESTTLATSNAVAAHFGGGTWAAWGAGKFSVAYSSGDTDFGVVEATGGFKGLQKHTHAVDHGHTVAGSGTLTSANNTLALLTSTIASHTHTTPNHTHATGNESVMHQHPTPNHTHTIGNDSVSHTHGYAHIHHVDQRGDHEHGSGTYEAVSGGSHDHDIAYRDVALASGSMGVYTLSTAYGTYADFSASAGTHSHDVSGVTSTNGVHGHYTDTQDNTTTGNNSVAHTHAITSSGGSTSDDNNATHTHLISSSGGGTSSSDGSHQHTIEAHAHTIATHTHTIASSNFTSSENAQTGGQVATELTNGNLPPFIVCYRYVRTA